ncbi:hypothetical protein AX768_31320 (plasmid) [Burkholderia sp. PAMC 28687]|nr:hypothetical protein AX768_31320 [Burkholderia sp. PAMC 28687]
MVLASTWLTGCTRSPSINVLGAYFPDWMFCIAAGVLLTIAFHVLALRGDRARWLWPQALVYPALVTLVSLIVWLIFFQH